MNATVRFHLGAVTRLVFVAASLIAGLAPNVAARVAPDPLPTYSSLTKKAHQTLNNSTDVVGSFISQDVAGAPLFIWDLQLVKQPDGVVLARRYEFQNDADELLTLDIPITAFPSGSVDVYSMIDVYGSDKVVYTDVNGRILAVSANAVPPGRIGSGGTVVSPGLPGSGGDCGPQGITTCGSNCYSLFGFEFGGCTRGGSGACLCQSGSCPPVWGAVSCSGSCTGTQSCGGEGGNCGCR